LAVEKCKWLLRSSSIVGLMQTELRRVLFITFYWHEIGDKRNAARHQGICIMSILRKPCSNGRIEK